MSEASGGSNVVESFRDDILEAYFRARSVELGLFSGVPVAGGREVSGRGYGRRAITFEAPEDGAIVSASDVAFGPALEAWGSVSHYAVFDLETGKMRVWGRFATPKSADEGDRVRMAKGDLVISVLV